MLPPLTRTALKLASAVPLVVVALPPATLVMEPPEMLTRL